MLGPRVGPGLPLVSVRWVPRPLCWALTLVPLSRAREGGYQATRVTQLDEAASDGAQGEGITALGILFPRVRGWRLPEACFLPEPQPNCPSSLAILSFTGGPHLPQGMLPRRSAPAPLWLHPHAGEGPACSLDPGAWPCQPSAIAGEHFP